MKVFLSWSGSRSHAVAKLLADWLPQVIQSIDPWISSHDIEPGSVWFMKLHEELRDRTTGISCLTADNLASPWMLFEAGAMAKGLEQSRVVTLLVELTPKQVQAPWSHFQHVDASKPEIEKLLSMLNKGTESPLSESRLKQIFEKFWPDFEDGYKAALAEHATENAPEITQEEMLAEILETVRRIERVDVGTAQGVQRTFDIPFRTKGKSTIARGTRSGPVRGTRSDPYWGRVVEAPDDYCDGPKDENDASPEKK